MLYKILFGMCLSSTLLYGQSQQVAALLPMPSINPYGSSMQQLQQSQYRANTYQPLYQYTYQNQYYSNYPRFNNRYPYMQYQQWNSNGNYNSGYPGHYYQW